MSSECNINVGVLPKTAAHGTEICDNHGNRWLYDAGQDGWISKGTVTAPVNATEQNDGLVSPGIYQQIRKLKAFVDTGFDFRPLKISPAQNAYWYYFRSSDKMFRFRAEGEDTLRIEVDRARIYQLIMREVCPGIRGLTGETGVQGIGGLTGADETCFSPSVDGERMDFAIFTPTPLLDPLGDIPLPNDHIPEISIRLYSVSVPESASAVTVGQLQHLNAVFQSMDRPEIVDRFNQTRQILQDNSLGIRSQAANLCDIPLSPAITYPSTSTVASNWIVNVEISPVAATEASVVSRTGVPIDELRTLNSIQYDAETNIVCGSLFLTAGNNWSSLSSNWCVKSRQKGPDGIKGDPGGCKLSVVECTMDDTNILATCPIINARLDCDLEVIYTLCADLLDEVCVDKVSLLPDSATLADSSAFKSTFAAAQMTLDECKAVHRHKVALEEDDLPELALSHWDPQPGCFTQRHFDRHEFNWIPDTDVPACDSVATWFGPDTVRPGIYPWEIEKPSEPEADECCQDDWFYCPNVQNAPCSES
jgi:hypothetical protein